MIKRNQRTINWINRLIDWGIIYLSYGWAVWFWIFYLDHERNNIAVHYVFENPWPVLLAGFMIMLVFQYGGLYDSFRSRRLVQELLQLLKYFTLCLALIVGLFFLMKLEDFSRGVMVSAALCAYVLLAAKRVGVRAVLRLARRTGYNQKHVLLVGSGRLAQKYVDSIRENPQFGFHCAGYVGQRGEKGLGRYLGGYDSLQTVLEQNDPDEVIIALEQYEMELMNSVIGCCEEQGIRVSIIPIYNDYLPGSATVDTLGRVRLISLRSNSQDLTLYRVLKRVFDILFALAALLLTSPVMLAVAIGVRLSGPGPILFRQTRVGKDRKLFTMYKFRSMVQNEGADSTWTRATDSRITPFGALIRKLSLDELPQFFNVLRGEMSVVGPRPELPFFVEKYRKEIPLYMVKHQMKPGITGWAQVNGYRGDTSIEKRIRYDLWYIENWSLFLDIKIILLTVFGGMVNKEKNLRLMRK